LPGLVPNVDPHGLLEYSVVYTDRALNHMSQAFQSVMKDISATLRHVYHSDAAIIVPGSGTFAMEAVARQLATGKKTLVLRNGWFSYRWTQIFDAGRIPAESVVLKARPIQDGPRAPYAPAPIDEVVAMIGELHPDVVFAPHVETASGVILPDEYVSTVAAAAHDVGALMVLDCIASGAVWVDMAAVGVDVLISAPQKGWTGSPCAGLVMLNEKALAVVEETSSTSFACDLKKWLQIMRAYEGGGHAYHATMPTDGLRTFRDAMKETEAFGWEPARSRQLELGSKIRALLEERGIRSVAAEGFKAPGVVVSYTDDDGLSSGRKFADAGLQTAAGVPLMCDEPKGFQTFRLGLFGLDKLENVDRTVGTFRDALDKATAS
jgi:alanine-glyoxylate transaminase / serine-glyoxylate transaminase / serine-pyruvate transaminase